MEKVNEVNEDEAFLDYFPFCGFAWYCMRHQNVEVDEEKSSEIENVEAYKEKSREIENDEFERLFAQNFAALVQALKEKFPNVVMESDGHSIGRCVSDPVYRMVKSVKYQRNGAEYMDYGNDRHIGYLTLKGNVLVCGELPDGRIADYQFLTVSFCKVGFTDKPFEVGTSDLFSEIETKAEDVIDFIREYWKEPETGNNSSEIL